MMSVLALQSICKRYGDTHALNNVSLEFAENCITAVIGRSGCGKSSLLRACNALLVPDSGEIRLFNRPLDYDKLTTLRRRIGYAVQGTGLFPHLTAEQNITLLASLEKWDENRIQSRLSTLLKLTHIMPEQLKKYPHQLSGGQQQRVGLCRAMMLNPKILLLDEPFAAIDPITRSDIHAQLLTLHRAEPTTAVLVTHDMREAITLADHIVVMEAGQICNHVKTTVLQNENPDKTPDDLLELLMPKNTL